MYWKGMSEEELNMPNPGEKVVLTVLPSGLVDDLPKEDQDAVREIVGKPVLLSDYDEEGRAELQFTDRNGIIHFIYVSTSLLRCVKENGL